MVFRFYYEYKETNLEVWFLGITMNIKKLTLKFGFWGSHEYKETNLEVWFLGFTMNIKKLTLKFGFQVSLEYKETNLAAWFLCIPVYWFCFYKRNC